MTSQNSSALRKLYAGFSALIGMLLILMAVALLCFRQMDEATGLSLHTYQVLVETHALSEGLINMDTGARGFAITGEENFLQPLARGQVEFPKHWAEVKRLTADQPLQQERLQQLQEKYRQWVNASLEPLLAMRRATPRQQAIPDRIARLTESKRHTDAMRSILHDIDDTESHLLQQRTIQANRLQLRTQAALFSGGAFAVLLGITLSILLVRNTRQLTETNLELEQEIAERKEAEAALRQAKEEAEQARREAEQAKAEAEHANHAKSEFLSRMSHELRTPLNAILGFGQLLEMDDLAPQQQQNIGHIVKGGRHLLDLINEVLDIAGIEAGHMQLSPEPVNVRDIVQESLALVRPLAAQRRIALDLPSGAPDLGYDRFVRADRQRLKQVLLNLLSNAIKYNRDAGEVIVSCEEIAPPVGLTLGAAERPGGSATWLHIQVRDTGPGIPTDKMERLFVPFDRLDAERTRIEGTGLGLALSRRLIEVMGGTMGVSSTVGVGSTFWFDLPQTEAAAMAEPTDHREAPAATIHPARTMLYIEDNLSNLQLIQQLLQRRPGIEVLPAMQGSVGLELAREHQPDLILLDLHLPDMPGHDVLLRLRAEPRTRDIPVVVLSADATPSQIERLRLAGAVDYLTKPLDVKRFLEVLDENLKDGVPTPQNLAAPAA